MSQALPPINASSSQDFQESPKVNKKHKSKTSKLRSLIVSNFIVFFLAFTLIFCGVKPAFAAVNPPACVGTNAEELGCWQKYPLPRDEKGNILPLESVHTSLLPDGKILMVNGSSNRNTIDRQTDATGTTDLKVTFIDGVKTSRQAVVDNTALFDPVTGTFEKISSPPAVQFNDSNDLFCTGHLHLPNGNIFFAGGSSRYYPGEQFEGSKQINVYNWEEQKWENIGGKMTAGRWYPSLVPLADGKVVIFSGQKYDAPSQITPTIEIYDPRTNELYFLDLTQAEDSPFNVKIKQYNYINADGEPGIGEADIYDSIDLYPRVFPTADGKLLITGDGAGKFPLEVHKSSNTYLMSVTKEALDKPDILGKPCAKGTSEKLCVSFEVGKDRKDISKVYGTAVADPNREGDILLLGGLVNNNNINFGKPQLGKIVDGKAPAGSQNEKFLKNGTRIAASLERWDSQADEWSIVPNFLHKDDGTPQPRAMNEAVILPNKEILTVNGGEYAEYDQVYEPLLMTYDQDSPGGYKTKEMNPATLPRLYHNGALLLPDARVLTISGNASRAARQLNGTVHVDVVPDNKEYYALAKLTTTRNVPGSGEVISQKDYKQFLEDYYKSPKSFFAQLDDSSIDQVPFAPAEIWQVEIFNPPYLFKAGPRPEIETAPQTLKHGEAGKVTVKNVDISSDSQKGSLAMVKLGSITHSFDYGQRLVDLTIQNVTKNSDGSYTMGFNAPENANLYTPGYYMIFYLNSNGKPSVAKMVQLEAA